MVRVFARWTRIARGKRKENHINNEQRTRILLIVVIYSPSNIVLRNNCVYLDDTSFFPRTHFLVPFAKESCSSMLECRKEKEERKNEGSFQLLFLRMRCHDLRNDFEDGVRRGSRSTRQRDNDRMKGRRGWGCRMRLMRNAFVTYAVWHVAHLHRGL